MRSVDIALARHGPVALDKQPWTAPRDLSAWIAGYDSASIVASQPPDAIKIRAVSSTIVCSTALRCVESAQRIAPAREILADAIYREADLPHNEWIRPKLPPALWAAVFRVAWFRGYSAHAESYADITARTAEAARQLIALARSRGAVLLIGHGIVNHLLARQLLASGCRGPKRPTSRHWGLSIYQMS